MRIMKARNRIISLLLVVASMLSLAITPAMAADTDDLGRTLADGSTSVTIEKGTNLHILDKSTGGKIGGSSWTYTSNDGIVGPAFCVNWGLDMVSPSKRLEITGRYDRSPKTMGAFANGYPQRTLEQFKELHPDIPGIENLTTNEYAYATQLAIWATCGQLAVPGTAFESGRASLVEPTSDAQQIRVFESVVEILRLANGWTKQLYTGLYFHMEKEMLGAALEIRNSQGLEGAADQNQDGIRKETINGTDYYTRLMYVDSATSTYIHNYVILVYSMDAPAGTIFTDINNQVLNSRAQWGATMYEVPAASAERTSLNANGTAYGGAFKICIPCDNVTDNGTISLKAHASVAQFNLYLAYNPDETEQSYIIADPAYVGLFADATIKWSTTDYVPDTATLQIQKVDGAAMPLEGAEFTLVGSKGTTRTGISDHSGLVVWTELPTDETYVLTETKAPAGFTIIAPRNITLTAGQTAYVSIQDDTEKHFYVKKIDKQSGSTLQGAVFKFEQIDGDYVTTATTGFDGMLEFAGDELPYGSYRVYEEKAPVGYEKDTSVQTVDWDGTRDVTLTFMNVRQPTIIVSKVDGITGVSLPHATFNIYKDGELIDTATTNDAGEFRFPIVAGEGYYEFEETIAPTGYQLDSTRHGIHVDPYDPQTEDDPTLTIENYSNPSLRIIKIDKVSGDRLADVTFKIYKDGELFDTLSTDGQGEIVLFNLDPGTYLVEEVRTDDGHVLNSNPQQIELKAGEQTTQTLVFVNQTKPGIFLIKLDSQSMQSIPNVRFEFKLVGGSFVKELVTDANGEIDITKLEPGTYEVRELEAPEGYLIDSAVRIVKVNPDENASFAFTNTKKPSLSVVKYDPNTGKYLAGATFRIARIEDGTNYLDRVTDINGRIELSGLEPGVYSVQELEAPAGYVKNDTEFHVELFPGRESQLVVNNEAKPDLKIVKTDAVSGKPVQGVTFTIKMADGRTITTEASDENGEVFLADMDPGVVEIWEQSVPDDYLLNEEHQLITLVPNKLATVHFQNHPKPSLTVVKLDSITGDVIEGVKFGIQFKSDETSTGEIRDLGTYFTDESGQIQLSKLDDGWYTITELEPAAGYAIKEPASQEVYVEAGRAKTVTFENTPLSAIIVKKVDASNGDPLQGAWFRVRFLGGTSGSGGTIIAERQTSSNGTFVLTGLKAGTYVIEEISAPDGYVLSEDDIQTVYLSGNDQDVITVTFGNESKGSVLIKKIDAITREPLSDVQFMVTKSDGSVIGNSNGLFTTDSAGTILIEGLEPGITVVAKEVRQKDGYVLDDTPQSIKVKSGETVTLEYRNYPEGTLQIIKRDSSTREPIEGVQFRITTSNGTNIGNGTGLFTTDASGSILIKGLEPETTVIITEVRAKDGYLLDDTPKQAVIKSNQVTTVEVLNQPLGGLRILKLDSVTRQPLEGVEFKVTYDDGSFVPDEGGRLSSNGIYRTDKNGEILISDLVGTIVVTETKTIPGYVIDEETRSQTVVINPNDLQTLTFYNTPSGGLQIIKSDEDTGKRISGVKFEVRKINGEIIGTYTTDRNGVISIPEAQSGWYSITELKAAEGYELDATPVQVCVKDGQTATVEITNQRMASIMIHKVDAATGEGIYGVKFVLYDSGKNPIGEYTTDQDGYIFIDDELTPGKYFIRELEAADGYIRDEEYKTVYVEAGKCAQIEWENSAVTGQIQIRKYALDDNPITGDRAGSPLEGAVFEITQARSGAVVGYIVSDARGVAASGPLPLGRYFITEVSAPKYYQLSNEKMEAEIEYPNQIIKLSAYNKSANLGVTIKKAGNHEVQPGQIMSYDFSGIGNTSNVALNSFFWHDRIPTDAVRAISLSTGTYSQRLYYKVTFKTNLNDYRTLASNLLTTNNYSLSLNAATLGLAQGEYVTDIRFEFGTVASGFASVVNPTMRVQVLGTVSNGYQIINRADVGGQYLNEWQTAKATWITVVRRFNDTPLPKTGY